MKITGAIALLTVFCLLFPACQNPLSVPGGGTVPTPTPGNEDTGGNTTGTVVQQGSIMFNSAGGWLEYGFAQWDSLPGAQGYTVYRRLSTEPDTSYVKVDAQLVRETRVDIPGLLGNRTYYLKVVPVISGAEDPAQSSVVSVDIQAHDRSGFAFDLRSPQGASGTSGGYNTDGTVNPAATILYITDANKDTVQMDVTKNGVTATYTGLYNICAARTSAKSASPLIIRFIGMVTPPAGLDTLKQLQIKDNSNVTYEGIGTDAELNGWGLDFQRDHNFEIRNLSFRDQPEDQISIQSDCLNFWVHNNDHNLGKGLPGGEADKIYGDGNIDVKSGTSWVTVSYNHYIGCKKTGGIGFGDDTNALVLTYHHNFYDVCGSRMPRISYCSVHVYNTYFKEAQVYAIALANACDGFIQNNYFENCKRPIITASQGHDLNSAGESTLSHNPAGTGKMSGNYMDVFTSDPVRFDPTTDITLGPTAAGAIYDNFDLNFGANYPCSLDTAETAKIRVQQFAGRINSSPNNVTPLPQTDSQKAAAVKNILQVALTGIYYTDRTATESAVAAVITAQSASFPAGVTTSYTSNEIAGTTTITITCGAANETIVVRSRTPDEKIAAAKAEVTTALSAITYSVDKTAAAVQAEIDIAMTGINNYGTTISTAIVDENIVVTIQYNLATDTVTKTRPADSQYVAAARASLVADSRVAWNTDAGTTLAAVNAAMASVNLYGATAAASSDANSVTVTISFGTASDTIVLASSVTHVFNVTDWATMSQNVNSNFPASGKTLAPGLSSVLSFGTSNFRVYATTTTLSLSDGSSTWSFDRYLQLRETGSTITITASNNSVITLVYVTPASTTTMAPVTLSGITTATETNAYTATGCDAISYRVSGTGTMTLGRNTGSTLLCIIITVNN